MIKVGMNVLFPEAEQKSHPIATDIMEHPAENIKYGWAYPEKTNDKNIYTHNNKEFNILESLDVALKTENNWIGTFSRITFPLNFEINGIYYERPKRIQILNKLLSKDNCKKIIFFNKSGLDEIEQYTIKDKSTYVYNAVPKIDESLLQKKEKEKLKILFIGTAFYLKGGAALVEAFEELEEKYPIELEIRSSLLWPNFLKAEIYQPLNHQETVEKIQSNPNIEIHNCFETPREHILNSVYPSADIFILPSMQEGAPYVIQEAMAYGLPIISTNCCHGIPEIVKDQKNGLIIDLKKEIFDPVYNSTDEQGKRTITKESQEYLKNQIKEKLTTLIENTNLKNKIRQNNLKKAKDLFSFKKRNKIIKAIYEESL